VAARRLWAALGLSSGRFVSAAQQFTMYLGRIWKYPINQPFVPYMHRISVGIVRFKQRGGEAVEL
jgi:hypothetical protein